MCADYTIVKVEPPTPSLMCYKYSYAVAHTLRWTNSLLKDVSQVEWREWGKREKKKRNSNRRNAGDWVCVCGV